MRYCFRTKVRSTHVFCKKANILTLGCDEGKYSFDYRVPSKEDGHLVLKRPKPSIAFRERFLKTV